VKDPCDKGRVACGDVGSVPPELLGLFSSLGPTLVTSSENIEDGIAL